MASVSTTVLDPSKFHVVAGGGGFIGGHLVARLRREGCTRLRVVDHAPLEQWQQRFDDVENLVLDLSRLDDCQVAVAEADTVFHLAADMGGIGFIENNKALCMLSVLISTNLMLACRDQGVGRLFYASSACVYAADKQAVTHARGLRETDAYPAMPEDGYGWQKIFDERMARHFTEDFGLATRVGRYHNVYGPYGTFDGGREKAPAAICRKVAAAQLSGSKEIEIWGDGRQTRSFTFIDDCIEGTLRLTSSDCSDPLNIGSSELVTINDLVSICEEIAGVRLNRRYVLDAPQGVRGRCSDNTRIRAELDWEPFTTLKEGLTDTYEWVYRQMTS